MSDKIRVGDKAEWTRELFGKPYTRRGVVVLAGLVGNLVSFKYTDSYCRQRCDFVDASQLTRIDAAETERAK